MLFFMSAKLFSLLTILTFFSEISFSQATIKGRLTFSESETIECIIGIQGTSITTKSDLNGNFELKNVPEGNRKIHCLCPDYQAQSKNISLEKSGTFIVNFDLKPTELIEVNAIGSLRETNRLNSPIITDIYDKKYFEKNPSPNLLEVMDRMNGVRQQINCNVCGTGDIHINGLEGPYTLIVLDGVPIVGGLSSVYGLSGIPTFMLDKIEITKGPASSLYGSEAMGGVIHAFTKKATNKPEFYFQQFSTSDHELNTDIGVNFLLGKKLNVFSSANHFWLNKSHDKDGDNFTDIPIQKRFSFYQKWKIDRKENRIFTISGRILNENRWGGELDWNSTLRGSDSIYAETIITKRIEFNLAYQLPFKEKILFLAHFNRHNQDSYYGDMYFKADQRLGFFQLTWDKTLGKHEFLVGSNARKTYYNDNTPLTSSANDINEQKPIDEILPGIFIQDQFKINNKNTLLISSRLDYHQTHKFIFTPRLAWMIKFNPNNTLRFHAGNGFRVVNLFSEDHAALSGAREVVISESLRPELSKSGNISYSTKIQLNEKWKIESDLSLFYTYFSNRIVADYDFNPSQIVYANINGFAESKGISIDLKLFYLRKLSFQSGFTLMNVSITENGQKEQQILTEKWSGNWTLTYIFDIIPLSVDYTGNIVGSMRLPLSSELDPRPEYSPIYSIQNIQFTYTANSNFSIFCGIKNLLNWTPAKGTPFLIARTNDPFDNLISYNENGQVLSTPENPFALRFDPSYVYALNQGIRFFAGIRMKLGKT
jgi:outer membrane receptor for ferrienterochelin and colicins